MNVKILKPDYWSDDINEYVFSTNKNTPVTTSRLLAKKFEKEHKHVMEAIRNILAPNENRSVETSTHLASCFWLTYYKDSLDRKQPEYIINEQGCEITVMGFNGEKAMEFKIEYSNDFKKMREIIRNNIGILSDEEKFLLSAQIAVDHSKRLKALENKVDDIIEKRNKIEEQFKELPQATEAVPEITRRKEIDNLVKNICIKNGLDIHETYSYIYNQYDLRHNVKLRIRAANRDMKVIEYIESENWLEKLYALILHLYKNKI